MVSCGCDRQMWRGEAQNETGKKRCYKSLSQSFAPSMTACYWYMGSKIRLGSLSCLLMVEGGEDGTWQGKNGNSPISPSVRH